jgi:hypothetical protein
MPFAGFKDFEACVVAQMRKGFSRERAEKICGKIKHKVEGKGKKSKKE